MAEAINPIANEGPTPTDQEIIKGLEAELESLDRRRAWIIQVMEDIDARQAGRLFTDI